MNALVAALCLVAVGCGGDDSGSTDTTSATGSTAAAGSTTAPAGTSEAASTSAPSSGSDEGEPQSGGTLTYAVAAESVGLDPVVSNLPGAGTGGNELVALYDTLIRFDPDTGEFVPRLAESLTPNADLTVWTLKLRPDITFTDGTPLDADAVTFHLKRLVEQKSRSATLLDPIAGYEATDPLTVELTMKQPWRAVPSIFAGAPGMIVSPTAVAALGDQLPTNPVGAGAGPFVFDSFKPGEAIVLKKNADYWGGDVYLDELRFVPIPVPAQALQALEGGNVQGAYFRDFVAIAAAEDAGYQTQTAVASSGNTLIMNNGVKVECTGGEPAPICEGVADGTAVATTSPTSDPRLRQAIAAAVNLDVFNQRVWEGKGLVGSDLIWQDSKWYDGVAGPAYDPDRAKQLVEEVKAEGTWDGSIRLECHNAIPNFGQAMKAQLEAVGFKVEVNDQQDIQAMIKDVIVNKDFDLSCFGTTIEDQNPYSALNRDLNSALSGYAGNWVGYSNPAVDAALADLAAATTDDEARAAITTIAKAFTADVPWLTIGPSTEIDAWTDDVHGVTTSQSSMVYFDKVWIG